MTTISAGAAAGLLVALMVMSTNDGFGAELQPASSQGFLHPGTIKGFNPQPDPPREAPQPEAPTVAGDGSVNRLPV